MENRGLLDKIKSKYIIKNNIFDFFKEKEFQEKLFIYSKYYQKKFDIKLVYLKEKYLKKIGFNLPEYCHLEPDYYKKELLIDRYNIFLAENNFTKEKIESIIYDIYNNEEIKDIDEEDIDKIKENRGLLIDIESPLFELISKTNNYEKLFTIHLSQKVIDNYNLKDNYIKFFDNLNNFNQKKKFNFIYRS